VQYIYETAFANQTRQYGLASAASVILGMILLVLTLFQLRAGRKSDIA
jgi:alpha-1,4-digalacturonate transport system permease protein